MQHQPMQHQNITEDMQRCIVLCRECHDVCLRMVAHCLRKGGRHAEPSHIRLLLDCVQICETSADFMVRGSDLHAATCGACAEVCASCAEDCERLGDDEMMRYCAQLCRRCAEICHKMAGALAETRTPVGSAAL
jgi:Domain of Unknown Function (DUF326)